MIDDLCSVFAKVSFIVEFWYYVLNGIYPNVQILNEVSFFSPLLITDTYYFLSNCTILLNTCLDVTM